MSDKKKDPKITIDPGFAVDSSASFLAQVSWLKRPPQARLRSYEQRERDAKGRGGRSN